MKKEIDQILCERYPLIFGDRFAFGFEEGWFDLIDTLCQHLQFLTDRRKTLQIKALQAKEKFGELSFYVQNASDEQMAAIAMACAMSSKLCEMCGNSGRKWVHEGWQMTRCAAHTPPSTVAPKPPVPLPKNLKPLHPR